MLRALLRFQIRQPNMEKIRNRLLDHFDIGLQLVRANQIAQGLPRKVLGDRRFAHRGECRQPRQAALQFAHIGRDILRDIERHISRQRQMFECRFLLDDCDPRFEIRRCDIGDQPRLEPVAQPIFEAGDIARHLV